MYVSETGLILAYSNLNICIHGELRAKIKKESCVTFEANRGQILSHLAGYSREEGNTFSGMSHISFIS